MVKDLFEIAEDHFNNAQYKASLEVLEEINQTAKQNQDWEACVRAKNELGIVLTHLSKFNQALEHLFEAQKIGAEYLTPNHCQIAITFDALGVVYASEKKYEQSNVFFLKALAILEKKKDQKHILAIVYNNMAWCLCDMGKYHNALEYHELALDIRLQYQNKIPDQVAQTYNNMATCHLEMGDTNKALIHYQKAFNIWQNIYGQKHPQIATALNNIGLCYSRQADFNRAIHYYKKALHIRQEVFKVKHLQIAQSFENIGYCLMKLTQYDEALKAYNKGFEIRQSLVKENHHTLVKIYRNIGVCYLEMQDFELAIQFLNKALKIYQQIPFPQQVERTIIYTALGDYYHQTQQHLQSIAAFHQVITSAVPDYTTDDVYQTPKLNKYFHQIKLGYALKYKGKAFLDLYLQFRQKRDLETGLAHLKKAVQVLNENRQSYTTAASKLNHAKLVINTYEWAVYAAYLSYQESQDFTFFSTAFAFAELSKSYVLFSKIKETEAKITAHIPSEILQKEQALQMELSALDKRIQQLQLKIQTSQSISEQEEAIQQLQSKYFDISIEYEQVIRGIEKDYPQYFQLKYDLLTAPPIEVQAHLSSQEMLINYFIGIENIFVFGISKNKFHFYHLPKPDDLTDTIEYIHDAIGMGDEDDLKDLGTQLFEQLLTSILSQEPECKQLIIIPDDCLHRLPFDVLVYESSNASQLPPTNLCYLIEGFQISYHYSASLWLESLKKTSKEPSKNNFLGIAPINFEGVMQQNPSPPMETPTSELVFKSDFDSDGTLKELSDSKAEIQGIYELFQAQQLEAKALFYHEATKENFLQQLEGKKYIVLSSHGFYNEESPSLSGIYFAKNKEADTGRQKRVSTNRLSPTVHLPPSNESMKLYISDTFHLPLDADLVVLSSCESGIGELQKGEGMLALNRGFLYAGAQNIIYSLFKVPDAASQFTPNFFRYVLQENCSYAAALQKAKLDLIESGSEPLFWAGFALVGK